MKPVRFQVMACGRLQERSNVAKRDIGQEILDGIREIKAHKAGQLALKTRTLQAPAPTKKIRGQLKL